MPSWDAVCVRKHSILFCIGGRTDFIFSLSRNIEKGLMQLFCVRYNELNNDIAKGSIIFVNLQNHLRLGKQSCINMAWANNVRNEWQALMLEPKETDYRNESKTLIKTSASPW